MACPSVPAGQVQCTCSRDILSTAKAHILLSDTGTRAQGLALLDETARLAMDSGLSHQLRSIESIRTDALAEAR